MHRLAAISIVNPISIAMPAKARSLRLPSLHPSTLARSRSESQSLSAETRIRELLHRAANRLFHICEHTNPDNPHAHISTHKPYHSQPPPMLHAHALALVTFVTPTPLRLAPPLHCPNTVQLPA
eukprot:scaffold8293_cov123-Isochrysis_galbana.AAC.8